MARWIRARVTVIDGREKTIFTDVGPDELARLIKAHERVEIASEDDWGRYAIPTNDQDREDRRRIEELLKCR